MKKFFTLLFISLLLGFPVNAQDTEEVSLKESEKSNNAHRKFCLEGNHELAVNELLLKAKKRGATITASYARIMCQKTDPNKQLDPK